MEWICEHCSAPHWYDERLKSKSMTRPHFGMCCLQGQVKLPHLCPAPGILQNLLCGISSMSDTFMKNIRQYNAALAFTSVAVKVDEAVTNSSEPYSFRVSGELHHRMGSLLPAEGEQMSYAQLYIHDLIETLGMCNHRNPNLKPEIMSALQGLLHDVNPYVPLYRHAYLIMKDKPHEEYPNLEVRLHVGDGTDGQWYNLPTADELAAVIPGDGTEEVKNEQDIVLCMHDQSLKRISQLHPSYQSLHYVLLFPYGELGWNRYIPLEETETGTHTKHKKVTQHLYYAYRLHERPMIEPDAPLFCGGRLTQQYIVDTWASIEQSDLNWVQNNQKTIRADLYKGLVDAATNADGLQNSGQHIVLPSSHTGSPRAMYQLYQDSMAICRALQKPDIFLTMTANP
ncbi:hypothetical protein ARMSODRAFT_855369, partial [Armillaria solidipes]